MTSHFGHECFRRQAWRSSDKALTWGVALLHRCKCGNTTGDPMFLYIFKVSPFFPELTCSTGVGVVFPRTQECRSCWQPCMSGPFAYYHTWSMHKAGSSSFRTEQKCNGHVAELVNIRPKVILISLNDLSGYCTRIKFTSSVGRANSCWRGVDEVNYTCVNSINLL